MLLAVDDDSSYLLVHEDEDGAEKSGNRCHQGCPPGVAPDWIDQPTSIISGRLQKKSRGAHVDICITISLQQVVLI